MKKIVLSVLVLALAAVAVWWFGGRAPAAPSASITLYGNIDVRQVRLGFRVGGRLLEVNFDEGDAVNPGDLLARLDNRPHRDAAALARARRDAAAAFRDKAAAGPRAGEIAQARAQVEALKADLELAESTHARNHALMASQAIPRETMERATATRDAAKGRLDATAETLALLLEGTRKEDLAAAAAEVRAAEAAVAAAETALEDTRLLAPSRGVVVTRASEPGTVVAAGETVLVLSLDDAVWAKAYVPEPLLGEVHPGRKVAVLTDARPDRPYTGTVGFVSPVAEFTPKSVETPELRTSLVYRIRVTVDHPDSGLRQGMPVTLVLERGRE